MFVKTVEELAEIIKSLEQKEKIAFDLFSIDSAITCIKEKDLNNEFTKEEIERIAYDVIDELNIEESSCSKDIEIAIEETIASHKNGEI